MKEIDIDKICKYISKCNSKDLYFIQKAIEFRREENKNKMFEGATNL